MCGITGVWTQAIPPKDLERTVCAMRDRLRRRGPDDAGVWVDAESGVALGHRRLSIIDLSPSGHQPMVSADGRFVVVYNGEIYNYQEVALELGRRGARFRGGSDSEVLVEALARLGLEATLERLAGMFAFAAWDRAERRLLLARDRLGIKRKWLLKRIAARLVPREVVYRRKAGFALPMKHWWRGRLASLLRELMLDSRCVSQGWIRPEPVLRQLDEHIAGHAAHDTRLWLILWLELWARIVLEGSLARTASLGAAA